jgi:hypothetical protein
MIAGFAGLLLLAFCVAPPAIGQVVISNSVSRIDDPESGGKPCKPLTCRKLGVECGEWDDGCGGTIDCGECEGDLECEEGQCIAYGEWELPVCDRVMGTGAVKFTMDDGVTLVDGPPLNGTAYTYGLAALDRPNTLLASVLGSRDNKILRSEDAGCTWETLDDVDNFNLLLITAAPGGAAYAWSRSRESFFFIEGDEIEERTAPGDVYGLAVDPLDAEHLRIGSFDCRLWESFDGGESFVPIGTAADTGNSLFYTVEFDPQNWDNALCGSIGAWRTTDAGASWSPIDPFDKASLDIVYLFRYSPSDPQRVWTRANLDTLGESERWILVSDDGGASFVPAVMQGEEAVDQFGITRTVILTNQPTMAAHPELPDVLYFFRGTYYQDYGTDLFRYDLLLDELGVAHTDGLDGVDAIEFSPADPALLYLGLESVDIN